jgi:hypothetical protein
MDILIYSNVIFNPSTTNGMYLYLLLLFKIFNISCLSRLLQCVRTWTHRPAPGCGVARDLVTSTQPLPAPNHGKPTVSRFSHLLVFTGDSAVSLCFPLMWFNYRHHCLIVLGHSRSVFSYLVFQRLKLWWATTTRNLDMFFPIHPCHSSQFMS